MVAEDCYESVVGLEWTKIGPVCVYVFSKCAHFLPFRAFHILRIVRSSVCVCAWTVNALTTELRAELAVRRVSSKKNPVLITVDTDK